MRRGNKIIVVVVVLLVGLFAALRFPKKDSIEEVVDRGRPDEVAVRPEALYVPLQVSSEAETSPASALDASSGRSSEPAGPKRLPAIHAPPRQRDTPPMQAAPIHSSAAYSAAPPERHAFREQSPPRVAQARPSLAAEPDRRRDEAPVRRHTIVDGDTLKDLAERYLGSGDRYLEIYAANYKALPSPDILPLGIEITIPLRRQPPGESAAQTSRPVANSANEKLVPVPSGAWRSSRDGR